MIDGKRGRWGCVVGIVGLVLATYLVLQPGSVRNPIARALDCTSGPCESEDPQTLGRIRTASPQVRVWSRTIELITAEDRASANIEHGQPGDSVWLDRGSDDHDVQDARLGAASIPAANTSRRTPFYRYAGDWLRACGKTADRPEIRCTRWIKPTDPPPDRRLRAVEHLLDPFDHRTGLWKHDKSTWQSANALTVLIDYMARTGDRQYLGYLDEAYRHGNVARTGAPRNTGYNDDELWWALAWIRAFDLTHEQRYLRAARAIVDRVGDQKTSFCDGGLAWARKGIDPELRPWGQVNSITNALYLTATASLSTRVDPALRSAYRTRATTTWDWFTRRAGHALLDPSGLINDHLDQYDNTCTLVDENRRWTYAQGTMISGLVALEKATGNRDLLAVADRIAAAATREGSPFIRNGLLDESSATSCPGPACHDAETYKGVFVRAYRELVDTGHSRVATEEFLTRQAKALHSKVDRYGFRWQGPLRADDHPNFATQAAALDVLNAA